MQSYIAGDTALVIHNNSSPIAYREERKRSLKKAAKLNTKIQQGYWYDLLDFRNEVSFPNLIEKHGVSPVHGLAEIELLASLFTDNIKQHNVYLNNRVVAGCTMFLNKHVAHAQYISGTIKGRDNGSLIFYLITWFKTSMQVSTIWLWNL